MHTPTAFLVVLCVGALRAQYQNPTVKIEDHNPVSASDMIYDVEIKPYCVDRTSGNPNVFATGQSVENFIALVERLELLLANNTDVRLRAHIGADNVAKLLLRRFRYDGYDPSMGTGNKLSRDEKISTVASAILTTPSETGFLQDYYFPNSFFNQAELCSLYYMLSHNIYDTAATPRVAYSQSFRVRSKRQSFPRNDRNQNYGSRNNQNKAYAPQWAGGATLSPYLPVNRGQDYPIKEEGVVSFRSNKDEAIQISRVLVGVIAGLAGADAKSKASDIIQLVRPGYLLQPEYDKTIDPVMMTTLADLYGVGAKSSQNEQKTYYWGLNGEWSDQACTTHYGLKQITQAAFNQSKYFVQATKAEIRGGIDGYRIGTALNSLLGTRGIADITKLRLSTILRSYYSKPQSQISSTSFTANYCDRTLQINIQDVETHASIWAAIVGMQPQLLNQDFKTALSAAQNIETNGFSEYCNKPSGTFNQDSPCETPTDVLYFVDGTNIQKMKDSATAVAMINGNLQGFRTEGGTVSIFFNSQQKSNPNPDVQLPIGTGQDQWPFAVAAFNSTNTGCAQCRIYDFNTTLPQAVANTGKYLRYLNATLMDYEWWTPRTNQSWIPSKTAVLIDFDSVRAAPDDGQDKNDYNWFKDQLWNRHRDVLFLSLTKNRELFYDILRDKEKDRATDITSGVSTFAKRICDNPATFQYNMCRDKTSNNVEYVGYISPGYKQNWAMYPEFFLKSFNIKFSFKAEDGNIRVCYDRTFPPQRQDYCFDTNDKPIIEYEIRNPCKGDSFESCDPFYFSVWGKDKTSGTQCLDARCQNLNQIKFVVTHSGVQCSSSHHLLPSTTFQVFCLTLFAILYLLFH